MNSVTRFLGRPSHGSHEGPDRNGASRHAIYLLISFCLCLTSFRDRSRAIARDLFTGETPQKDACDVNEWSRLAILGDLARCALAIDFTPDGATLAVGMSLPPTPDDQSGSGDVDLWDLRTQKLIHRLKGHKRDVGCLAFIPNSNLLVSGSEDHDLRLWDVSSRRLKAVLQGHQSFVKCVAASRDGRIVASGGLDSFLIIWDIPTGKRKRTIVAHEPVAKSILIRSDNFHAITCGLDGNIKTWDMNTGSLVDIIVDGDADFYSLAMTPDEKIIATGDIDGVVKLWDYPKHRVLARMELFDKPARSLAFSPDGKFLAVSTNDTVSIVDVNTRQSVRAHHCNRGITESVKFSPTSPFVASCDYEGQVVLWGSSLKPSEPAVKKK